LAWIAFGSPGCGRWTVGNDTGFDDMGLIRWA
jgi:hypothetical protein